MPVNKVLLPNNAGMDFAPGGGSIGWVPMSAGNTLLSVAENIINDGNSNKLEDHAIPSPIAYVKHFKYKLDHDDPDAINEWRGMLAAIALQKHKGFDITIKDIPIYPDPNTGNPTALGKVICEELISNSDITGYKLVQTPAGTFEPNFKTLSVFCKDGVPFAMFMPSMLICPFKAYPINLFSGLQWYDDANRFEGDNNKDPKGTWLTVADKITSGPTLSVTGQMLYLWIQGLINAFPWPITTGFANELLKGGLAAPVPSATINPIAESYTAGANVYLPLKNVCPLPAGAPTLAFSDKVLFIVPQADLYDEKDPKTGKDYRIDKAGFTPMKRFFFGQNAPVYVVPPIHPEVVESIKSGKSRLSDWRFDAVGNNYRCQFSLHFPDNGQLLQYVHVFTDSEIVWTESMPYISMWPYVNFDDDSWKEHYVAVCANNEGLGGALKDYTALVSNPNVKHILGKSSSVSDFIECPEIKISLVAKNPAAAISSYKCMSAYKKQEIKLLSSNSQPFALEFSYVDAGVTYKLGSWIINREAAPDVTAQPAKTYYVAMDFGTTSTNIYLREDINNGRPARSISSAGKYLCDIYNPYARRAYNGECESADSDFIQNYYLFGSSGKELGKIFTYGQNFTAVKDGIPVGGTVSNASGRMVVVDESFILDGEIGGNSGIWNGLKIRTNIDENGETVKARAANNFICNALTYAVLEAKADGASAIKLRVSYPKADLGNVITDSIEPICADLQNKSQMNIDLRGSTEARAAGEYFVNANTVGGPTAAHGYAIVDIGGGTTDFSFWKADNGSNIPEMKAELSFGYAGNYLVERSILQGIQVPQYFSQIWSYNINNTDSVEARAINRYNSINIPTPIGPKPGQEFYQKVATIDFLLDRCKINAAMLDGNQYENFLSAVRMKYYSLFMLIASFIKKQVAKGTIQISPISFRICLAGCGSKGMEFARMGSKGMAFNGNLTEIFSGMLNLSKTGFMVVAPVTTNKEEVVIGLTYVNDGAAIVAGNGPVQPDFAPNPWGDDDDDFGVTPKAPAQEVPAEPEITVTYEEMEKAYARLVNRLAFLELPHGADNKPIHNGTSLVDKINCGYPAAREYFNTIFANVEEQTRKAKPDPETFADTFALLMLENMIDYFIQ